MRPPPHRSQDLLTRATPAGAHRLTVTTGCQRVDRAEEGRNDPTEETDAAHPASVVARWRGLMATSMLAARRTVVALAGAPRRPLALARRRGLSRTKQHLSRRGRTCGTTKQSQTTSGPQGARLCWHGPQAKTTTPQDGLRVECCGRTMTAQRTEPTSAAPNPQRAEWWPGRTATGQLRCCCDSLWPGPGFAGWP